MAPPSIVTVLSPPPPLLPPLPGCKVNEARNLNSEHGDPIAAPEAATAGEAAPFDETIKIACESGAAGNSGNKANDRRSSIERDHTRCRCCCCRTKTTTTTSARACCFVVVENVDNNDNDDDDSAPLSNSNKQQACPESISIRTDENNCFAYCSNSGCDDSHLSQTNSTTLKERPIETTTTTTTTTTIELTAALAALQPIKEVDTNQQVVSVISPLLSSLTTTEKTLETRETREIINGQAQDWENSNELSQIVDCAQSERASEHVDCIESTLEGGRRPLSSHHNQAEQQQQQQQQVNYNNTTTPATVASGSSKRLSSASMLSATSLKSLTSCSSTQSLNGALCIDQARAKHLARAAKKCSKLYEELERLLFVRTSAGAGAATDNPKSISRLVSECDVPCSSQLNSGDTDPASGSNNKNEAADCAASERLESVYNEDDNEDDIEDRCSMVTDITSDQSSSRDDQISLSSSSLSLSLSDTLPEIKQRKNLQKLYHIVNEICSSEEKFVATIRLLNVDFRHHVYTSIVSTTSSSNSTASTSTDHQCQQMISISSFASKSQSQKQQKQHQQQQQMLLLQQAPYDCIGMILKHLPQLQALNENLLDELKRARDQWPKTQKISHVLVKIGPFLKHYSSYIRDFELIQAQYYENLKRYPQFGELIKQFERVEENKCSKLSIQHHLLKPIQRIPQYRLLLQQYLHHLKPDDADYEDTISALEVVSRVAEHANQSLSEGANLAKLLALQAKIVGKQRDIIQPGRLFIKEGELLKVCRKQVQPRFFVLLNDSLLYMKQIQSSDILYLKYELPLDDCQVGVPGDLHHSTSRSVGVGVGGHSISTQAAGVSAGAGNNDGGNNDGDEGGNDHDDGSSAARDRLAPEAGAAEAAQECEFNVRTTVRSMALVAKSRQERDNWVEALRRAIDEHVAKRRSFTAFKSQQAASDGAAAANGQAGAATTLEASGELATQEQQQQQQTINDLIGRQAPIWTPDSRVSTCQLCTSNFSALFRRHHCRACGRVVCSACSSNRAPLIYLKCRAARVCDQCFDQLRANMHLYYLPSSQIDERELRRLDEHFKILLKSQFVKHVIGSRSKQAPPAAAVAPVGVANSKSNQQQQHHHQQNQQNHLKSHNKLYNK